MDRTRSLELDLLIAFDHGTRRGYQIARCRCVPCSAANTAYSASYRRAIHAGHPPLGAHVAGPAALAVVADLVADGWTKAQISYALGHDWPRLQVADGVTWRTLLRLKRLQRTWTT